MKVQQLPYYFSLLSSSTSAFEPVLDIGVDLCASNSLLSRYNPFCTRPNAPELLLPIIDGSPSKAQQVLGSSSHEHNHEHHHSHDFDAQSSWTVKPQCLRQHNETERYCVYTDRTFASNRGISIVTNADHSPSILQLPAFTNEGILVGSNSETDPRYEQRPIPGKGLGLVATRPIHRGEELFRSTPVLILEEDVYEGFQDDDRTSFYHTAIKQLPKAANKKFHDLMGHFGGDPVEDKINTNCFAIEMIVGEDGETVSSTAVFPEMSRMNHDCRPNAHYYFDSHALTQHVHALRTILPGEEITISYIDPTQSSEVRKNALKTSWGFPCGCNSCNAPLAIRTASDSRIEEIVHLQQMLSDYSTTSPITNDETGVHVAELLVELYTLEGLLGPIAEAYAYAAIEYNSAKRKWEALRYANLAVEAGLLYGGPGDGDVRAMGDLIMAPERHWSWDYRARKRWEGEQEKGVIG